MLTVQSHFARYCFYVYLAGLSAAYVFVLVNAPLTLISAGVHDDGLFITLGRHLVARDWLGPYTQFTLMKGPGYPAFLAISNLFGIPVLVARACFHCFAIVVFAIICKRFVNSYLLSAALFTLLLWDPTSFQGQQLRAIRDTIYYAQALLCIGLSAYALLNRSVIIGLAGGLCLGWFWLTREEGIWLAPGLILIIGAGLYKAMLERALLRYAFASFGILIAFGIVQLSFRTANWWYYGAAVGVDVKETNFVKALRAIHSVRSGGVVPFVSVTRGARESIYRVSPSFTLLAPYLDGPGGEAWSHITCNIQAFTCGEIGSGVFLWALRDAAASIGQYTSPAKASAYFGNVAGEIDAACKGNQLECDAQLVSEMPPVTWNQLAGLPYDSVLAVGMILSASQQSVDGAASLAIPEQLADDLRFLRYPIIMPPEEIGESPFTISGWYRKLGGGWITTDIVDNGQLVSHRFDRAASPDIAAFFKDPAAEKQRFVLHTFCTARCHLRITADDGRVVDVQLKDLKTGPIQMGNGTLFFDRRSGGMYDVFETSWTNRLSFLSRKLVMRYFETFRVPILIVGLLAVVLSFQYWRDAVRNETYVLSLALWTLAASRIVLISLLDLTFVPAINPVYLAPASFMLTGAAVLSIGAWLQLRWRNQPNARQH